MFKSPSFLATTCSEDIMVIKVNRNNVYSFPIPDLVDIFTPQSKFKFLGDSYMYKGRKIPFYVLELLFFEPQEIMSHKLSVVLGINKSDLKWEESDGVLATFSNLAFTRTRKFAKEVLDIDVVLQNHSEVRVKSEGAPYLKLDVSYIRNLMELSLNELGLSVTLTESDFIDAVQCGLSDKLIKFEPYCSKGQVGIERVILESIVNNMCVCHLEQILENKMTKEA